MEPGSSPRRPFPGAGAGLLALALAAMALGSAPLPASATSAGASAPRSGSAPAGARSAAPADCNGKAGTLYLTIDTGNMRHAEEIAGILSRHSVRATFFLANERTFRGDYSLDPSWRGYWAARANEGHAFGSHTWRHGVFRKDVAGGVVYAPQFGEGVGSAEVLDGAAVCQELDRVNEAFRSATGRPLDALWRAPAGRTTPNAVRFARACGYRHVHWAPAGFLGDELPSDRFPNQALLAKALRDLRDGDILMMHLGIWSRKDPFAPTLEPLLEGLKAKGFCFATVAAERIGE